MAMQFISSQICHPGRKGVLPEEFYDHVSEIIKIFRKQITIFVKLSSSVIQLQQAIKDINQKTTQGMQTAQIYKQVIIDDNLYIVVQRFLSRVKQIIQLTPNVHLGVVGSISTCLKKIQLFLHKSVNSMTIYHVFCDVLNILPSYFQSKPFSPEKNKKKIKQHSPNMTPSKNSLDHILQSYRKSFTLLSTLDIDEAQYRAVFFSARDSRYKGTTLLQNQMKHRNRFIKEEMNRFDHGYVNYVEKKKKEKENSKKRKSSKMKRIMSEDQQTSIVRIVTSKVRYRQNSEHPPLALHSLKETSLNTPQLKTINQIPDKNTYLQQTAYNFNRVRQRNGKSFSNTDKNESGKKKNENGRDDQFQDFINQMKTKGEFRMTKVLFGNDGKLQLSPFANQKKQEKNPFINCLKNKIIFRKAQQNIRKKFNRITTEPPSSNKQIPKQKKSPPCQIKNYMITQHSDQEIFRIDPKNSKKVQKLAFRQKQVKLMGIKGVSNKIKSNSFDDSIKFWSNNISNYMREEERSMV